MGRVSRIKNDARMYPAMKSAGGCVDRAYNFLEIGEDELEINMYGEVVESVPVDWWTGKPVEGLYISEKDFLDDLDKYKEKSRITVRINSVGGDLYAGLAIANRIKGLKAEIITVADALCASAAVAIYQTGSTRKIFRGSQIMIHEPSCYIYGRYDVHGIKKVEKQLEAGKKSLIKTYEERTGRTEEDIERMITADSWMTGQEAIDEGFADELIEGDVSAQITEDKKIVISNGIMFPAEAFFSLPGNLRTVKSAAGIGTAQPVNIKEEEKGGKVVMTKKELMDNHPELYDEIVQESKDAGKVDISAAVQNERKRIMEIDEIANQVGDEELVRKAKFGDSPMNASELALAALKRQNEMGTRFIEGMKNDAAASGAEGVKPMPNAGLKSKEEQERQDIMDGAALIAGRKGEEGK